MSNILLTSGKTIIELREKLLNNAREMTKTSEKLSDVILNLYLIF